MSDPFLEKSNVYVLDRDGGIYRWRDLFEVLGSSFLGQILPLLVLDLSDPVPLQRISRRFVIDVDRIEAEWDQRRDPVEFHRQSARLLETTFAALAAEVGTPASNRIFSYGVTTDTGIEFLWVERMRELVRPADSIEGPEISEAELTEVRRRANDLLSAVSTLETIVQENDEVIDLMKEIVRIAQVRRMFERLSLDLTSDSLRTLLGWARRGVDRRGGDGTVLQIREDWLLKH